MEVIQGVIPRITVTVMDDFVVSQAASENAFHQQPVPVPGCAAESDFLIGVWQGDLCRCARFVPVWARI